MNTAPAKILVMGYGNPGRLDDGLGPAFVERLAACRLPGVDTEADYQLTVEDAEAISRYDVAVFVDASVDGPEPYACTPLAAEGGVSFTSHHLSPGQVLSLARELFQAPTEAYLLAIRGYEYNEFGERLSAAAAQNLNQAVEFFVDTTREGWGERRANAATGTRQPAANHRLQQEHER